MTTPVSVASASPTTFDRAGFTVCADLDELSPGQRRRLCERATSRDASVRHTVADIIARVRGNGDTALEAMAREFDGVDALSLEVPRSEWRSALAAISVPVRRALEHAAANIDAAHRSWRLAPASTEVEPGVVVTRRPDPLQRVGIYAPGGRAAYPSSVLMGAIPARVAGVGEVILCSPPDISGGPAPIVLAAAAVANVDRVFAVGGAGAIAAMALGTNTIPRVDRVVGPGNAYVAEAKAQLSGEIATDAPAGPSELLVVADASTDPGLIAREAVAQAEHDPRAAITIVLVGYGSAAPCVDQIVVALDREIERTPRREIVLAALSGQGALLTAQSLEAAIAFANDWAPEHLLLAIRDAEEVVDLVRNAGTVCVGVSTSVVFGDYLTGANHVLPTGGLARSYAGLSTQDFVRWTTIQRVSPDAAARLAVDTAILADGEGLPAHAAAARAVGRASTRHAR
jgi:histidinol dehydrogenase